MKTSIQSSKLFKISVLCAAMAGSFAINSTVAASELVVNGGFEANQLATGSYGHYGSTNPLSGWSLDASSKGTGIEIQNQVAGAPAANGGNQFAELDSNGTTKIFQDLATTAGQQYSLSFMFSPRPNVSDNQLRVNWGNSNVASLNAIGGTQTNWNSYSYLLTATSNLTRLSFDNLAEISNGTGTYIDNVSVKPVPLPGAVWFLASGLVSLALGRRKLA